MAHVNTDRMSWEQPLHAVACFGTPDHSRMVYILIDLRADVALPQRRKSWHVMYMLEQQEPLHG